MGSPWPTSKVSNVSAPSLATDAFAAAGSAVKVGLEPSSAPVDGPEGVARDHQPADFIEHRDMARRMAGRRHDPQVEDRVAVGQRR